MNASFLHRVKLVVVLLVAMLFVKVVRADEQTYQRVIRSTVLVVNPEGAESYGLGTGVLIDANRHLIATAGHVVGDKQDVRVCFPVFGIDGRPITSQSYYLNHLNTVGIHGKVLIRDRSRDVAIVQLDSIPPGTKEVPLATKPVMPGQAICAIGNSGGDDDDFMWCYRDGSVRQACHKKLHTAESNIDANMIETSIASNHGDSGGPVLNSRGELLAITVTHHADHEQQDVGQQVGYCTDVSEIRAVLGEINMNNLTTAASATTPVIGLGRLLAENNTTTSNVAKSLRMNETTATYENDGVAVHVRLRIFGYAHHNCQVICTLADANGNVVRDTSGRMYQVSTNLTPGFDDTNYYNDTSKSLDLHFATAQIHGTLGTQAHRYSFLVSVRDTESGAWITTAARRVDFTEGVLSFNELMNNN